MHRKLIVILLSLLFINHTAHGQEFFLLSPAARVEYNQKTKTYGIKDLGGRKWLTPPVYQNITQLAVSGTESMIYYGFLADKGNKKILIAAKGSGTMSPMFEEVKSIISHPGIFIVKTPEGYYFFKLGSGILTTPGLFSSYSLLSWDLVKILIDKRYFLVSVGKDISISPAFDYIYNTLSYNRERLIVSSRGKWGVSDRKGSLLLNCSYDTIVDCREGFLLKKGNKWGLCNANGKVKLDPAFDSISPNGYTGTTIVTKNHKWGLMDSSYKQILSCSYEAISTGLFLRNNPDLVIYPAKYNSKWGILTSSEKWLIPNEYDSIVSANRNYLYVIKNKKMGVIDLTNKTLFPFVYDYVEREDEHNLYESADKLYLVARGHTNEERNIATWGMADSTGKLIQPVNVNMLPLSIDYIYRPEENGDKFSGFEDSTRIGYLWNTGGNMSYAMVAVGDTVETAIYDVEGNEMMVKVGGPTYYSPIITGGKTGILNRHGKMIVPQVYDELLFNFENLFHPGVEPVLASLSNPHPYNRPHGERVVMDLPILTRKDSLWGALSWNGKELLPCKYDTIVFDNQRDEELRRDNVFFKVYRNNKFGYYSISGKEITAPEIDEEAFSFQIMQQDSSGTPRYDAYDYPYIPLAILVNGAKKKIFNSYAYVSEYDANGNEYSTRKTIEFTYYEKAKFQFQNFGTRKLMAEQWSDDAILLDGNFIPYTLSSLGGQLRLIDPPTRNDSLFDVSGGKLLYTDQLRTDDEPEFFSNYAFLKYERKWYLHDLLHPGLINKDAGFDSVIPVNANWYNAWRNGQFAFYNYNYKGPFHLERTLDFPNEPGAARLACRDCEYRFKNYLLKKISRMQDGDTYYKETIFYDTLKVPVIQKGKFNIIDSTNMPLLKTWADDLLMPPVNGLTFSPRDTLSGVFNEGSFQKNGYPFFSVHVNSIALNYKGVWRLTTLQKQNTFIDGFSDVRIDGDTWVVKKKRKELYYGISDLKKIKKK